MRQIKETKEKYYKLKIDYNPGGGGIAGRENLI